jgi:Tfp pilus assembly protein PilF
MESLMEAGNTLNMIVLDACRDNPFGWSRGGTRGLSLASHAPSGSIIMYATSANSTADDGTGSNGIFTSQLLKNLETSGLSVFEVFDKTMGDVISVTKGKQHPELSLKFSGASSAYLGSRPSSGTQPAPSPQPSNTTQNAQFFFDRGEKFYYNGDYETAIADYTEAIRIDPNFRDAYYKRGYVYRNKNDNDRAIADFTQVLRIEPNNDTLFYWRGQEYFDKEEYDNAISDFTQAIRIDPKSSYRYEARGRAYLENKDYNKAISDYTQALRIDPDSRNSYYHRGIAYFYKKDYDRAIADYESTLKINPNDSYAKAELEIARKARGY